MWSVAGRPASGYSSSDYTVSDASDSNDSDYYRSFPIVRPIVRTMNELFDDTDDADAFSGISRCHYTHKIQRLKDDDLKHLNLNFNYELSDEGRMRLGSYLATCERGPDKFSLSLTEAEEMPQSMWIVFQGPFQKSHSLKAFKVWYDDGSTIFRRTPNGRGRLTLHDWECIAGYLKNAPSLQSLRIKHMRFGEAELGLLASGLTGATLKYMSLLGLETKNDASLGNFISGLNTTDLRNIKVVACGVGQGTCQALAHILRAKGTKLESISINSTGIDDDFILVLCDALAANSSVLVLQLNDNRQITHEGWGHLEKLVFDTSSLKHLYSSNHTLRQVLGNPNKTQQWEDAFFANRNVRNRRSVRRLKIFNFASNFQFRNGGFNTDLLIDLDIKLMPRVLAFFGNHSSRRRQQCLYELARQWNVPALFGLPSAERERLSAKMSNLETENDDLRRQVEMLRRENSMLASENNMLKSDTPNPGKRARRGDD